jgi:MarR-like DNA-binding transcriptional regulator SgrR of sgrS sRNA
MYGIRKIILGGNPMTNKRDNQNDRDQYFKERAGTDEARFHVVPHDEESWAVKIEGKKEPAYTSDSKSKAIKEAERMAKESKTIVYIHEDDGKIERQLNYMES